MNQSMINSAINNWNMNNVFEYLLLRMENNQ